MGHWLAPPGAARQTGFVKRFDPRFWTVNFPRPMMASVVTSAADALRVDCVFYKAGDLAGLIWETEDRFDHPLTAYETSRDFRTCRLAFHWRSGGVVALDQVNGPTLTIEGRDEAGTARSWYVRLWNYATGTPEDSAIALDFAAIAGGWEGEDAVWAGDVDRMFVSLVPPGFTGEDSPLDSPAQGWAELTEIACDGSGSVLSIGDVLVPEHRLRIATGYDDLYHVAPARVLRNALHLGYRGLINHYVGMSHYFRLEANSGGFYASLTGGVLNGPCQAWHRDFAARAKALGFELILSLSFELLDQHCWGDWKQRTADGSPALTGWSPPSTLLSPAHEGAMGYLRQAARAFAAIAAEAGLRVRLQIGEPWWWVRADGTICLYDAAAQARLAPEAIADARGPLSPAQEATLDAAGALLAEATAAIGAAVRTDSPDAELLLLVYLPGVLDGPEVRRANLPFGWGAPAFDRLQLEDYEWVTGGRGGATAAAVAEVASRLGYPMSQQHYFAGFVPSAEDRGSWTAIAAAADAAFARATQEVFVWALPQVLRDGFARFEMGEGEVDAFDDVLFPLALGREASVQPAFSTQVVTTASGAEHRNSDWANARLHFDAGPGVREEEQLKTLISFFRARRGAAVGFRFRDPFDHEGEREPIGNGDGVRSEFSLVKSYGTQIRPISRPVAGSVRIFVGGEEQASGWSIADHGLIRFEAPPAAGAVLEASFLFDVPVRFAEDRLAFNRTTFLAGEIPSVPLIEIREG
jgi:uncharacterized protein (TIGR02217 family)